MNDPFLPFATAGMRPGLARIRRLLAVLDHPERAYRSILITGSNGKGTTAAYLAACLQGLGFKTGLFTSPHLVSVRERFRIQGRSAPLAAMQRFLRRHGGTCRELGATYFETTTAFALWWFKREGVEWAVLEIGLGGRYDACNAVNPELSMVTSISLEHTEWLGRTHEAIALEKACVARRNIPVLSGAVGARAARALEHGIASVGGISVRVGREVVLERLHASSRGSRFRLTCLDESVVLQTCMPGQNAVQNAALAVAAAMHVCRDPVGGPLPQHWKQAVQRAVLVTRWPARLEVLSGRPCVVLDVAHNAAAVGTLVADWQRLWPRKRPVIVAGLLGDKPSRRIGRLLATISSRAILTRPDSPRAQNPERVAQGWSRYFKQVYVEREPARAFEAAVNMAGRRGTILVAGSHFVVGPVLAHLGVDTTRPLHGGRLP